MMFGKKINLTLYCLVLSVYTVAAFHLPFFRYLIQHVDGGANAAVLTISALVLLLAVDFLFY